MLAKTVARMRAALQSKHRGLLLFLGLYLTFIYCYSVGIGTVAYVEQRELYRQPLPTPWGTAGLTFETLLLGGLMPLLWGPPLIFFAIPRVPAWMRLLMVISVGFIEGGIVYDKAGLTNLLP